MISGLRAPARESTWAALRRSSTWPLDRSSMTDGKTGGSPEAKDAKASSKHGGVSPGCSTELIKMGTASFAAGPIFPIEIAASQRTESRGS